MKLAFEYTCLKVNEIDTAILFLTNILGLEEQKSDLNDVQEGLVFSNEIGGHKIVLIKCSEGSLNPKIVLHTNDCIHDYHTLKDKGIKFIMIPDYTDGGLIAEFIDSFGNNYCLLEERDYKFS